MNASSDEESRPPLAARPPTRDDRAVKAFERPKRPLSAYNLFFQRERQTFLKEKGPRAEGETGKMVFAKMAKNIAAKWNNIDEETKKHFEELAKEEKIRHKTAMAEWKKLSQELLESAKVAAQPIRGDGTPSSRRSLASPLSTVRPSQSTARYSGDLTTSDISLYLSNSMIEVERRQKQQQDISWMDPWSTDPDGSASQRWGNLKANDINNDKGNELTDLIMSAHSGMTGSVVSGVSADINTDKSNINEANNGNKNKSSIHGRVNVPILSSTTPQSHTGPPQPLLSIFSPVRDNTFTQEQVLIQSIEQQQQQQQQQMPEHLQQHHFEKLMMMMSGSTTTIASFLTQSAYNQQGGQQQQQQQQQQQPMENIIPESSRWMLQQNLHLLSNSLGREEMDFFREMFGNDEQQQKQTGDSSI